MSDKSDSNNSAENAKLAANALIIDIAQNKSRASYIELFKMFAPKLKSFVMAQGLNNSEAEDLAQDAMLLVWRKAHLFNPQKAGASTWIYTIARNLRIDLARKIGRKKPLPDDLWHDFDANDAESELIKGQSHLEIKIIMEKLNVEQKEVLKLSFYENLSHSQIADALNLPLGTVKSRIRLAISRLKGELNKTQV